MLTKRTKIVISNHAWKRWKQYSRGKKLYISALRKKLNGTLLNGFESNNRGVEVYITSKIKAVFLPLVEGGWIVVTFKPCNYKDFRRVKNNAEYCGADRKNY